MRESQRERILQAFAELVLIEGYSNVGVLRVCTLAGVSNSSFYKQFINKQDAFTVLLVGRSLPIVERINHATRTSGGRWPHQTLVILRELCDALDEQPALARQVLLELPTAGGHALAEYHRRLANHINARKLRLMHPGGAVTEWLLLASIICVLQELLLELEHHPDQRGTWSFTQALPLLIELVARSTSSQRDQI